MLAVMSLCPAACSKRIPRCLGGFLVLQPQPVSYLDGYLVGVKDRSRCRFAFPCDSLLYVFLSYPCVRRMLIDGPSSRPASLTQIETRLFANKQSNVDWIPRNNWHCFSVCFCKPLEQNGTTGATHIGLYRNPLRVLEMRC